MPKLLSDHAITQYQRDGYYFPIKILDEVQVSAHRALLEDFEKSHGTTIG